MTTLDLITKQDLEQFKDELFAELKKYGIGNPTEQIGKGSLLYYKQEDIIKLLEANTVKNSY